MKKGLKKLLTICTAAVMLCGASSLAACGTSFTPPAGGPSAEDAVESNGGFVVKKGEYLYFVNGVESYTAENTYGVPVKGALQRIKEADAKAGNNTAETVIPTVISGDYKAGVFIYGDRIYYATPNSTRDTSGVVQSSYLDFKSAKLDGSDVKNYFYVADNSTEYRYVEQGGVVYLVYKGTESSGSSSSASALISYNTQTGESVTLVRNYLTAVFDGSDVTDPYFYYTMSVTDKADSDGAITYSYQQIYRVRADATKVPEGYAYGEEDFWDTEYLEENNEGVIPYCNLGELVLDGRGKLSEKTAFNHSDTEPDIPTDGYTFTLRSYLNGGLYFIRTGGEDGNVYYLPLEGDLPADWDSVAANKSLEVVANARQASSAATTSALYFIEKDGSTDVHHYLYVKDDEIHNITSNAEGGVAKDVTVAYNVSGATLKFIDDSAADYKYVYFSLSNGNGTSVERAVYNGEQSDYSNLPYKDQDLKAYASVRLLDLQHASGWYDFEIIGGTVYYADAEPVGSTSYNYVAAVNISDANGLWNNKQLDALNEKYNAVMGTDGLVETLSSDGNTKLSALISYYFKSGSTAAYDDNLKEAEEYEQSETYLYSAEEKDAFAKFVAGEGYTDKDGKELFKADDYKDGEKNYRTRSYFIGKLGTVNEADEEAMALGWRNSIQRYVAPAETEEEGLLGWQIALIVIACALVAAGVAVGVVLYLREKRKKAAESEKKPKRKVDLDVDKDYDVYGDTESEPVAPEAEAEAEAEEPAPEEPAEQPAEEPAEESEEAAPEAEESAEAAPEGTDDNPAE